MSEIFRNLISEFDKCMKDARMLLFLSVDAQLQEQGGEEVARMLQTLRAEKHDYSLAADCDKANFLLACDCYAGGVLAEFSMWACMKDGDFENAWNRMVDAQQAYQGAIAAHSAFAETSGLVSRLITLEKTLFPPQTFMSAGLIVSRYDCSICRIDYSACDHIAGKPYCGVFCRMIAIGMEFDHSAIVDNPADKGCRITEFEVENGFRDKLTRKVRAFTEEEIEKADRSEGMRCTSVIMRAN